MLTEEMRGRSSEIVTRMKFAEHKIEELRLESTTKIEFTHLDERVEKKLERL